MDRPVHPGTTVPGRVTDYQPHVDGLRAIAIVAVVAYHIGIPGFVGGFVGVDVFFVISGYLIIGQIASDLRAGRFSLAGFYARRALRILPPFLLVLAVCFAAAPLFLFTPREFQSFALSSVFAPIMLSNFYFKVKVGYFDVSADQKPLLHTWTLSVEEQFYLLAPLLLIAVFFIDRRRFGWRTGAVAAAMFAASLAGLLFVTDRDAAFYYVPWRAWEFIAGGVVAVVGVGRAGRMPRVFLETIGLAGVAAIAAAVVLIDARRGYPSAWTMLPVFGAAAVILAGFAEPRIVAARLLSSPPMVGIGLVSYAWYLWHWPLLSFGRLANFGAADLAADIVLGGIVAFLLAVGTYFLVEAPVRKWRRTVGRGYRPVWVVGAGAAATVLMAVIGGGLGGLEYWRAGRSPAITATGGEDAGCRMVFDAPLVQPCQATVTGLVLGDSHADAIYGVLAKDFGDRGAPAALVSKGGCDPVAFAEGQAQGKEAKGCDGFGAFFDRMTTVRAGALRFAVVVSRWNFYPRHGRKDADFEAGFRDMLALLERTFDRVVVVGPVPEFTYDGISCVALADRYGMGRQKCDVPRKSVDRRRAPQVEAMAKVVAEFPGVRYVDPIDLFCDATACRPYAGELVYFADTNHLTPAGAEVIGKRFAADFVWAANGGGDRPLAAGALEQLH